MIILITNSGQEMYINNHIPDPVHSVRSKKYQLLYDSSFVQFVINTQCNGV